MNCTPQDNRKDCSCCAGRNKGFLPRDEGNLAGFLDEISLYTDLDNHDPEQDCVVMMTMHSAKGLEFPHVFLVGMEEGLFPSSRCLGEPEELEEERRLCYVAITRARQTLTMSYARSRMLYGRTTTNIPSRFLDELPEDYAEKPVKRPAPEPYAPRYSQDFGRTSLYGDYQSYSDYRPKPKPKETVSSASSKPKSKVSYQKGDMVQHKAFGRGMVLTVLPMGGDALLEIAFDGVGTKRLMANTASLHMKKL